MPVFLCDTNRVMAVTMGFCRIFQSFVTLFVRIDVRKDIKIMRKGKICLKTGIFMMALFVVWTMLIQTVDVQSAGQYGAEVGFATFNSWFHQLTGVHMVIYTMTDWLGLVPVFICLVFGTIGLIQMIKRKSLIKVDLDIILLGIYYVLVIFGYLIFEMIPINYRPILIEGRMEASYPSSTTLLVLNVMPTLCLQVKYRIQNIKVKTVINLLTMLFTLFMVIGRLISGVHWFTDIVGAVFLSTGLYSIYQAAVLLYCRKENEPEVL